MIEGPYDSYLFRKLNAEEEEEFRQYARLNDPPSENWDIYHPVCRDEWEKRGLHPRSKQGEKFTA
jgi:hypothetical protein